MKIIKPLIFTIFCLCIAACQEDEPVRDDFSSWVNFYDNFGPESQEFTVNAARGDTLKGFRNFTFYFPPNAFISQNGGVITGDVTVRITEYLSPQELFLGGLNTMGRSNPLISAGAFVFEAKQGDEILQVADNVGGHVMLVPYDEAVPHIGNSGYWNDWVAAVAPTGERAYSWRAYFFGPSVAPIFQDNVVFAFKGTGGFLFGDFLLNSSNLNETKKLWVSVEGADLQQTRVIFLPKGYPCLAEYAYTEGEYKVNFGPGSMPDDLEVRMMAVSLVDNKLKYGYFDFNTTDHDTLNIELTEGTIEGLKSLLTNSF